MGTESWAALAGSSVAERPAAPRASVTAQSSVVWEEEAKHEHLSSHFILSRALTFGDSHPPSLPSVNLGPGIISKILHNSLKIIFSLHLFILCV